jgi:hypothetical protein
MTTLGAANGSAFVFMNPSSGRWSTYVTSLKKILSSLFFLRPMFRCLWKQWRTGLCIAFLVSVVRDEPY